MRFGTVRRNRRLVLGARHASDAPGQDIVNMCLQRIGRRFATATRIPGPMQDNVVVEMRGKGQVIEVPVQLRIAQLGANGFGCLPEPVGLDRRELPGGGYTWRRVRCGIRVLPIALRGRVTCGT